MQMVLNALMRNYRTPGARTWSLWEHEDRVAAWKKFLIYVKVNEDTDIQKVRAIFESHMSINFNKQLSKARTRAERDQGKDWVSHPEARCPRATDDWISDEEWVKWCEYWQTEEFKEKSAKAKANRNCGVRKLAPLCGKKSAEERLHKEGKVGSQLRALEIGYLRNGEWTSTKAKEIYDLYKVALEVVRLTYDPESMPNIYDPILDPDKTLYSDVVGGPSDGRLFGFGRCIALPGLQPVRSNHMTADRISELEQSQRDIAEQLQVQQTEAAEAQRVFLEQIAALTQIVQSMQTQMASMQHH